MTVPTASELAKIIGKTGWLSYDSLKFGVKINDAKIDSVLKYLVTPVNGKGQIWALADQVELNPVWAKSGE